MIYFRQQPKTLCWKLNRFVFRENYVYSGAKVYFCRSVFSVQPNTRLYSILPTLFLFRLFSMRLFYWNSIPEFFHTDYILLVFLLFVIMDIKSKSSIYSIFSICIKCHLSMMHVCSINVLKSFFRFNFFYWNQQRLLSTVKWHRMNYHYPFWKFICCYNFFDFQLAHERELNNCFLLKTLILLKSTHSVFHFNSIINLHTARIQV